jgi:hypothetical protein
MEWRDEEVGGQESTRGGAWQVGWLGPQRGQAARKSREQTEGRVGKKSPKDARLSAQRTAATAGRRKR